MTPFESVFASLQEPQAHALGTYRHDVAYTAALKSCQTHALGSYRHDVAYTAALKSSLAVKICPRFTGVEHCLAPVIFFDAAHHGFTTGLERA
jgi:hypothetical protein